MKDENGKRRSRFDVRSSMFRRSAVGSRRCIISADLYFAVNVDPTYAEGFTTEDVASLLLRFRRSGTEFGPELTRRLSQLRDHWSSNGVESAESWWADEVVCLLAAQRCLISEITVRDFHDPITRNRSARCSKKGPAQG